MGLRSLFFAIFFGLSLSGSADIAFQALGFKESGYLSTPMSKYCPHKRSVLGKRVASSLRVARYGSSSLPPLKMSSDSWMFISAKEQGKNRYYDARVFFAYLPVSITR
jgi:hypothetical protein